MSQSTSGELISTYLDNLINREEQRRQRFETRATALFSVGGLTLATVFAALKYGADNHLNDLRGVVRLFEYLGLVLLCVALGTAMVMLLPRRQDLPEATDFEHYVAEANFSKPHKYASRRIAESKYEEFESISALNDNLAILALISMGCLFLGFVLIAISVSYQFS